MNKFLKIVTALSFIAIFVTLYLTYLHYAPEASEYCNFNDKFNCDIVNKSPWATLDLGFIAIPVSLMGLGTYILLFLASLGLLKQWDFTKLHKALTHHMVVRLLTYLTFIGVIFSLYLTYIEAFVLHTFCIFCLAQQLIILIIFVLFLAMRRSELVSVKA